MDELTQQVRSGVRAMSRWRWVGLGVTWAVALIGAAVLWRMPDRYEASARVYVDTQTVLKPLMAGLAVQPDVDQQVNMLARTLITRPNIETLMRSSDLDLNATDSAQRDGAVEAVASSIKLTGGGRENIYDISYRDKNPEQAKRVVQNLVSMFVESGLGGKRRDSESARRFIDDQIKVHEVQLQEAEARLKNFKLKNFGFTGDAVGGDYFARVGQLNDEVARLRVEIRATEDSRDAMRRELKGEEPILLPDATMGMGVMGGSDLDMQLVAQKKTLDELLRRYTDRHPDVIATRNLIKELEAQRKQQIEASASAARQSPGKTMANNPVYQQLKVSLAEQEALVASMKGRLSELQSRLGAMRESGAKVPQLEAEMTQMNRDYDVMRKNYEQLVVRRESAKMSEGVDASSGLAEFRVIDPPRVSSHPVFPSRMTLLPLVLLVAVAAGLLVSFGLTQVFPTVHDAKALRETAGRPVLGTISMLANAALLNRERLATVMFAVAFGGLLLFYGAWLTWISVNPRV
ncbi:MAG: XrtA system polysaccharide chain length determinant [Burkholderiaceae bacterium]